MKKLMTLFMLSMLVLGGCAKARMYKAYEQEHNYQRSHQQSQKGFNELDRQ